jgi:hypothetical protein
MYYHTKCALTTGIVAVPDEICEVRDGRLFIRPETNGLGQMIGKKDWFRTPIEAQNRVSRLALAKIDANKEQLERLEALLDFGADVHPYSPTPNEE